nr:siderophore-interacting protein [uncultured Lichenicoccus sp.]
MTTTLHRTTLRVRHQTRLRLLQVLRVEQVSPRMRRITLGGEALDGFASAAADDHVKLFFPAPGQDRPVVPEPGPDGPIFPEGATPAIRRDYTPRRHDAQRRELVIEFVLHTEGPQAGGPHAGGPASDWAAQAAPGQWLGVGGPRGSHLIPRDFDTYLLAGDETALPAIARALEEMDPGTRALVLIEVADRDEERYLPTSANASITWLHRNGAGAGTTGLLLQALRAFALPPGDMHAWLAGEIETIRGLRRHLVDGLGLPRSQVRASGYWRIGSADSHASLDD